jgi:HD-GYP domain-containing protein (c-di-GMP phosphodiesterase class II)
MKNVYRIEHIEFLRTIANSIMLSLEKNLILEELILSSTLALAKLADERDNDTGVHLVRMTRYTTLLAELLMKNGTFNYHIDIDFINALDRFSPLHDIGKVAISDSILLKPGQLLPWEFDVIKTHTTYGGRVLRLADENINKHGYSVFGMGIEITEGHHERWDGTGYPFARKGDDIPLSSRITAVADVFDALTSKRPYKNAMEFEISAAMILSESGTHFDPRIINVFQDNLAVFKDTYESFKTNFD